MGGRRRVVAVPSPLDDPAGRRRRVAVAPEVERERVEPIGERFRHREVGVGVEPGGVRDQQRRPAAAEIVDGDGDAVARLDPPHRETDPSALVATVRDRRHQLLNSRSSTTPSTNAVASAVHVRVLTSKNKKSIWCSLAVLEHEDDREGGDHDERDQLDRRTARTTTCRGVVVDRPVHDPYLPITVF